MAADKTPLAGGRRAGRVMAVLALACFAVLGLAVGPAAASVKAGSAQVVQPDGRTPLSAGASGTPFTLKLPPGAACPGDTAHKFYLIDSYVEPLGTNLATIRYAGGFPITGNPLVDVTGEALITVNSVAYTGQIPNLPPLNWQAFADHGGWPPGTYNVGVSCADRHGLTAQYWNTRVRFLSDPALPGGFTWVALDPPRRENKAPVGRTIAGVVIVVAIVGVLAALLIGRRRRLQGARGPV
jgi:hypothetical protein